MSSPAAFQATFADFRLIKGRKVAQLIFELPIEGCDAALEAMGIPEAMPQPHEERWAAIARIDLKAASAALVADDRLQTHQQMVTDLTPLKRSWSDLSYAQQAGIRCNEPDFWKFINTLNGQHGEDGISSAMGAASFVRIHCGVKTRADIMLASKAGHIWEDLNSRYERWRGQYSDV